MFENQELIELAAAKAALRQRIAAHRLQCAAAATTLAQPLAWLDQALLRWKQLSPLVKFVAVPLGFLAKRSLAPRVRTLGALLRWGPFAAGLVSRLFHHPRSTPKPVAPRGGTLNHHDRSR